MSLVETAFKAMRTGRAWRWIAQALLISICGSAAAAEPASYPSRPVVLVSPFTPGSGSDLTARAIAPALQAALGQPIVIENRSGAGGAVGARAVAKATPDGYTLLLGSASFSVLPAIRSAGYDPVKDFDAVIMMGTQQLVFVVPTDLPVKSVRELVALAKTRPGQLNYSSAGIGSIGHLQWELLKQETGIDIVHVPFSGTPQAMSEVIAGRAQMSAIALPTALPQIAAGRLKALAVQGDKRSPELASVPTMAEAGFPSLGDGVWYVVLAPKGTPHEIIDKLNAAFRTALADAGARRMLASAGVDPLVSTPDEAGRYLAAQVDKWAKVVRRVKLAGGILE